ncbi:hypothetical protein LOD99_4241 [Oopsacas minuta]|uniref:Uncharacterized protein n=1 Tax=Oopsacas minuta TaxID=111878 RepID=A0AAV7JWZ2_9METZ|nr:hypothetical protein LOD99_4241 [Oopsacas minuta]
MGSNLSRSPSENEIEFTETFDISTAGVEELWNVNMCIMYIERKLDDLDLDTHLRRVMIARDRKDISYSCRDTRRELRGRLCLLKTRQQKLMKEIIQPDRKFEKRASICRKQSEKRRRENQTHVPSYKRPCHKLASLDEVYRSYTQRPLPTIQAH